MRDPRSAPVNAEAAKIFADRYRNALVVALAHELYLASSFVRTLMVVSLTGADEKSTCVSLRFSAMSRVTQ